MSLFRTFWWENELSKLFGSRDRILSNMDMGVAIFGFFANFLKPFLKGKFCSQESERGVNSILTTILRF